MKRYSRAAIVIACLFGLSAQAALETGAEADFCARLATELGVKKTKVINGHTFWKASALNFAQRFLVGGTASYSMVAQPVDRYSIAEYNRVSEMCGLEEKSAACRLVGPALFELGWKGTQANLQILEGEKAIVLIKGTKVRCQPGVTELSD